eukprot:COSAG04_NODE_519_length_13169_cov_10.968248_12_plen_305_part_00
MAPGAETVEGLALALAAFQQAREEKGVVAAASALGELGRRAADVGQLVVAIIGDEQQLAKALEHHAAGADEGSLTDALAQSVGHVIASWAKYTKARSTGRLHKELKHAMRLARRTESLRSVVARMSEDSSSDEEGEQEQEREHQQTQEQEEASPQPQLPQQRTPRRKTPPTEEEALTPGSAPATTPPPATPAEESGDVPQAPPNSPAEELPPDPDAEPVDGQQLASATSEMSQAEEHDTEEDDDDTDDEDYDVEEEDDDDEPATERKPPRPKGSPPAAEPLTVTASSNSLDVRQKVKARRRKQL